LHDELLVATHGTNDERKPIMMTSVCMSGGGMALMGLFGLLVLAFIALGVAALIKYLFSSPRL